MTDERNDRPDENVDPSPPSEPGASPPTPPSDPQPDSPANPQDAAALEGLRARQSAYLASRRQFFKHAAASLGHIVLLGAGANALRAQALPIGDGEGQLPGGSIPLDPNCGVYQGSSTGYAGDSACALRNGLGGLTSDSSCGLMGKNPGLGLFGNGDMACGKTDGSGGFTGDASCGMPNEFGTPQSDLDCGKMVGGSSASDQDCGIGLTLGSHSDSDCTNSGSDQEPFWPWDPVYPPVVPLDPGCSLADSQCTHGDNNCWQGDSNCQQGDANCQQGDANCKQTDSIWG